MQSSREKVLGALNATYRVSESNKPDFNSATPSSLAAVLTEKDPLLLSVNAGDRYQQLAKKLLDYRDKNSNGVIANFDQLSKVDGLTAPALAAVNNSYALGPCALRNFALVDPEDAPQLRPP